MLRDIDLQSKWDDKTVVFISKTERWKKVISFNFPQLLEWQSSLPIMLFLWSYIILWDIHAYMSIPVTIKLMKNFHFIWKFNTRIVKGSCFRVANMSHLFYVNNQIRTAWHVRHIHMYVHWELRYVHLGEYTKYMIPIAMVSDIRVH